MGEPEKSSENNAEPAAADAPEPEPEVEPNVEDQPPMETKKESSNSIKIKKLIPKLKL